MLRFFMEETRLFLTAMKLLTRLPLAGLSSRPDSKAQEGAASRYFSFVGWIVGGLGALAYVLAGQLWAAPVAVLISMAATLFWTGARHEDGFADVCDAFGGGMDTASVLRILKDSRLGTFGVTGLTGILGLKFVLLLGIAYDAGTDVLPVALALVAGHALSRFSAASLLYTHDSLAEGDGVQPDARPLSAAGLFVGALGGLAPLAFLAAYLDRPELFLILLPVLGAHVFMARMFARRIGGVTGDCPGAAQQATEVVFYLSLQPELWSRLQTARTIFGI